LHPALKAIFQVHRNVNAGPGENTEPSFIANEGEDCPAETVIGRVEKDAKTYSVQARKNKVKDFKPDEN